jgi:Phage integrase family
MQAYLHLQRDCPQCGNVRHSKGTHHTVFRTVFGSLPVASPRLTHGACQTHDTQSFSPLADLLPEHTSPELLYLETKWVSLVSYGMTVALMHDVLPIDEPLQAVTIRHHVFTMAERLEDALGDEHSACIEGCPRDWGELPMPNGPLTVGIDGGYVKAQGGEQGWFEVIAGKSILAFRRDDEQSAPSSKCFAFVQTYDEKPKRRLFELLQSQGLQMNQQIEFLSDGGETIRDLQLYLSPEAEHLLDWFHTQDEVRRLFAVITSKRDRTLLQLTYHHGLRASEASLLQRDNIHEKQGRIYIPRVKGSIAKTYPMQPEDVRLVRTYLRTRDDDSPYLFISMRGIPLERRSYWDLMQKYGEGAAIPKPKRRFHALRHAIAVHLLGIINLTVTSAKPRRRVGRRAHF